MKKLSVINEINHVSNWLTGHQQLLIQYVINMIIAIIILFSGIFLSKIISRSLNKVMKSRNIDITVTNFISTIFHYGSLIFTIIAFLNCLGVQTSSIIAVIGAAGLAVGLALQGSLSNFAAGVLLVTFRHFHAGDYVDFGGTSGTVMVVQLFSTTLRTYDGKIIIVPNSKIISGNITNFFAEPNRLLDITISVNYNTDFNLIKKVVNNLLLKDTRIIKEMGTTVRLSGLRPTSIDFIIRAWVPRNELQNAKFDLLENIKISLDIHKIGIIYPSINISLTKDSK
ncbi:mechanosensitive ion channel domain-containing protein [Sodalis-like secondary symbiont of Drepanosiphum platanoidis]|uniref:mechanosensitive ion channel domain-containing protein n=1 Tax=Sodalis-like secondary symbiont of Drepanosiphum platanoidis TaxID=2994493 RepID=UPI0034638FA9